MRILRLAAVAAALVLAAPAVHAAGEAPKPPPQDWSFGGLFGTFNRADAQRGFMVYKQVCAMCHDAGVAFAPKLGDKAEWAPRIAQGTETLHKHAIEGYQGKAGFMPPKGGRTDLTDQSVINAVEYMVAQSK